MRTWFCAELPLQQLVRAEEAGEAETVFHREHGEHGRSPAQCGRPASPSRVPGPGPRGGEDGCVPDAADAAARRMGEEAGAVLAQPPCCRAMQPE
eukprot:COSAG05_NODE_7428_length_812_cov_1.230014_1_plen_95_part_00